MSKPKKRSRVIGGAVVAVLWLAMFVLPSACIIAAGKPRWLALAVGLAAFPLGPLGWHTFGEWRRKRQRAAATKDDAPKPTTLTSWDRLVLRTIAIALLSIGGTIFFARAGTLSAVRHHALWFTDWSDPDPIDDSPLLQRVPADAQYVAWVRPTAAKKLWSFMIKTDVEIVVAGAGDEMFMIASSKDERTLDLIETVARFEEKLELVSTTDHTRVLATPKWRDAKSGAPALVALLHKAPSDASMTFAARGGSLDPYRVSWAVGWANAEKQTIGLGFLAETVDATAGDAFIGTIRNELERLAASKKCGDREIGKLAVRELVRDGLLVRGSGSLPVDATRELSKCLEK